MAGSFFLIFFGNNINSSLCLLIGKRVADVLDLFPTKTNTRIATALYSSTYRKDWIVKVEQKLCLCRGLVEFIINIVRYAHKLQKM